MRNVLLTFALLLTFSLSYGQIKVVTSGDVGMGTSTPVGKLNVVGTSQLEFALDATAGNPDFTLQVQGASKAQFKYNVGLDGIQIGANGTNTGNAGISGTDFFVSGAAAGNVGVGTATPATKLDVNGSVTTSGGVYFTGGSTSAAKSSSNFQYGLETIMAMNPSRIDNSSSTVKRGEASFYSLDAKKLSSVAPEFVKVSSQKDFDDNSKMIAEEDFYYVNSTMVQLALINAVQQQQELIEAQNERIAEMEATIINLANGTTTQAVEVKDSRLGQNAPNPFNQSTVINYTVPTKSNTAVLQIFDLNGQVLKTVNVANGNGQLTINAGELAAGTYSYNLVVDGSIVDTKKMVLTK